MTSRIFIVDMLRKRIPPHLIGKVQPVVSDLSGGFILGNAHTISYTSNPAFILRVFRSSNKTGFIKVQTISSSSKKM